MATKRLFDAVTATTVEQLPQGRPRRLATVGHETVERPGAEGEMQLGRQRRIARSETVDRRDSHTRQVRVVLLELCFRT